MSEKKKKSTRASFVKSLTIDELRARQSQRSADSSSPQMVALAQAPGASSGVLSRLKERAAEAGQSVKGFVAHEQSLLRQHAIEMDESEFCLEPEEIALLFDDEDELPLERRQHLESCALCQKVVEAAKFVNPDGVIGLVLAAAASQGVASEDESQCASTSAAHA